MSKRITNIGFTGTRQGLTNAQHQRLANELSILINSYPNIVTRSGACIGADYEFEGLMRKVAYLQVGYPSNIKTTRNLSTFDVIHEELAPLERNKLIVRASDIMIGCPLQSEEVVRSGTWATIRYAKKKKKPLIIVYPDGTTEEFNLNQR